ncbi:hypothetical protein C8F04DRAFT_1281638 [Mycena alexandri]|uniref:Uncharacterized protein n=1 Tax=Mycena alexandri TaxID=1745969 RepID=A0AAD6RY13_9AGAR|nr:hypothetical protein C8F04DRAFT_1281638 [Mycena alexandri]
MHALSLDSGSGCSAYKARGAPLHAGLLPAGLLIAHHPGATPSKLTTASGSSNPAPCRLSPRPSAPAPPPPRPSAPAPPPPHPSAPAPPLGSRPPARTPTRARRCTSLRAHPAILSPPFFPPLMQPDGTRRRPNLTHRRFRRPPYARLVPPISLFHAMSRLCA